MWSMIASIIYGIAVVTMVILCCVFAGACLSLILLHLDRRWHSKKPPNNKDNQKRG